MVRRLLVGLVLGFIVGGLVAAGMVAGLKIPMFVGTAGAALAYLAAAATGVLTGLVAGKPIWASGAKIEAGLKAFFGALIGVGVMFALRQWAGGWTLDLSSIGAGGPGAVGELPAASLPLLAAVLGAFFELDNTGADQAEPNDKKRIAASPAGADGKARARLAEAEESELAEAEVVSKRAKR